MYASPRYSRHHGHGGYGGSPYSPTKYYGGEDARTTYSPPLKAYQRGYVEYSPSGYQPHHSSPSYYHQQQEYYHSGSSTASSSQDGYYADELDELEEYADPDHSTVPNVPTPLTLSLYETGKKPSGRVLVTAGNQTVEFFSCAVNAPLNRCVFVQE